MEVEYCHDHAIPHSHFLSWPEVDQDTVVAYLLYKAQICPQCGTNPDEWLDADGTALEPAPYEAYSRRCIGCATLAEERREFQSLNSKGEFHTYLRRTVDAGGTS